MKTLSLVIPIYNEGKRIDKTLRILKRGFCFASLKLKKVILVDDGSADNIKSILKAEAPQLKKTLKAEIQVISYKPNRGRGYAVMKGALNCNSDYVLYTDADFSIPLNNLKKFIPYMEKNYDLLFGSKKKWGSKQTIKRSGLRTIVGFGHSLIAWLILGVFAWDFQGGFKIFSRKLIQELFPSLTLTRWGFDMEIIFLAKKLGYRIIELPVVWGHIENNSKVKLARDILRAFKDMKMIRLNWINKNYSGQPAVSNLPFKS